MKQLISSVLPVLLFAANVAHAQSTAADSAASANASAKQSQAIIRADSQASGKGLAEYFLGNVRVSPLFPANPTTPVSGAYVSFDQGARSAWHNPSCRSALDRY